jgi:hypothetical protein
LASNCCMASYMSLSTVANGFSAERAASSHEGLANHMEAESRTAFPPPRDYVRRLRNAT